MFERLLEWEDNGRLENWSSALSDGGRLNWCLPYIVQAWGRICARTFCITRRGLLVIGPYRAKEGDTISTLYGVSLPIVLRKRENGEYLVVGDAYVHGIMKGQVMENGRGEEREFVLS
jgi:hypothetical protein